MDQMKKKNGFTLIELITATLLSGILLFVLACQFISMVNFGNALKDRVGATREARIVTRHMGRFLRFGMSTDVQLTDDADKSQILAGIEQGHLLGGVPANAKRMLYRFDKTAGTLSFWMLDNAGTIIPGTVNTISDKVTFFNCQSGMWSSTKKEFTLQLKFVENGVIVPIQTTITMLGGAA